MVGSPIGSRRPDRPRSGSSPATGDAARAIPLLLRAAEQARELGADEEAASWAAAAAALQAGELTEETAGGPDRIARVVRALTGTEVDGDDAEARLGIGPSAPT